MSNAFSLARFDNGGVDAVTTTGVAQVGAAALTGAVNLLTTAAGQTAAVLPGPTLPTGRRSSCAWAPQPPR